MKHSDKRQQQRRIDKAIKAAIQAIEAGEYETLSFGKDKDGKELDSFEYRYSGHFTVSVLDVSFRVFNDCGEPDYFEEIKGPGFIFNYDESEHYHEVVADLDKWEYLLEAKVKP